VQQMAAENRPTYNVFVSETTTAAKPQPFRAGGIGLGSYATQCEYKDITITTADGKVQKVSASQFKPKKGEWIVEGDIIRQTSNEQLTVAQLPDFSADSYTLQLKARKLSGMEGFFIYYGLDERGMNGYGANIGGWNNRTTAIQPMRRGRVNDVLGRRARQSVDENKWYDVKIDVTPMAVTLYVDGQEMTVARPAESTRQCCQAGYDEATGEMVIKVVNGTNQPYRRSFAISGATTVIPTGKVITLCGDANDENTFEQPTKLAPQTTLFGHFGKQFDYEFAPMSFTIMRIKASK